MAKKKTANAKSGSSLPTQNTRGELFLAKAAGEDVTVPSAPYTRLERFLKAIIDRISSFVGLPEVTSSDNGKILGVVNGEWDKTDAPTGLGDPSNLNTGFVPIVSNDEWTYTHVYNVLVLSTTMSDNIVSAITNFISSAVSSGTHTVYSVTITDGDAASDRDSYLSQLNQCITHKVVPVTSILGINTIITIFSATASTVHFSGMDPTSGVDIIYSMDISIYKVTNGYSIIISGNAAVYTPSA